MASEVSESTSSIVIYPSHTGLFCLNTPPLNYSQRVWLDPTLKAYATVHHNAIGASLYEHISLPQACC